MVLDGPKPLQSIEKQTLFLILGHSQKLLKNDAKGDLKSHVFGSKMATHGPPSFDLSSDFWCFGAISKNHHFWTPYWWTKKSKKSSLGAPRAAKNCQGRFQGGDFGGQGSKGASSAVLLNNKTIKQQAVGTLSATPTADGQANLTEFGLQTIRHLCPCVWCSLALPAVLLSGLPGVHVAQTLRFSMFIPCP